MTTSRTLKSSLKKQGKKLPHGYQVSKRKRKVSVKSKRRKK